MEDVKWVMRILYVRHKVCSQDEVCLDECEEDMRYSHGMMVSEEQRLKGYGTVMARRKLGSGNKRKYYAKYYISLYTKNNALHPIDRREKYKKRTSLPHHPNRWWKVEGEMAT